MKERIRQLMEAQHMNQQSFAGSIGISNATLSSIFNGRTNPTNKIVEAIHNTFPNVRTDWLMWGTGPMFRLPVVLIWNSLHAFRLPSRNLILPSRWTCSGLPKWQNPSGTLSPTRHHENTSYPRRRQRPKGRLRRYVCSMMTRRGSRSHRKSKSFGVCVFLQKIPLFGTAHSCMSTD